MLQVFCLFDCKYVVLNLPFTFQEDMNLNEERKAPLREKDLSTKREMVVQYISATAKSVSRTKAARFFSGEVP